MIHVPRHRGRPGLCKNCLWKWPELYGGEGFRCYNPESEHYHQEHEKGCRAFEKSVRASTLRLGLNWGTPGMQYIKSKSGIGGGEKHE